MNALTRWSTRVALTIVLPALCGLSAPAAWSASLATVPDLSAPRQVSVIEERDPDEARAVQLVAEREKLLADMNRQAERHENLKRGLREVLADYGYVGDPDEARLILPLSSYRLSARFGLSGPLWVAAHGGQDFGASMGEPLVAVTSGTITDVGMAGAYGLRVVLTLDDGTEIWYCHLSSSSVSVGDVVEIADQVGNVGSTGNSTGPHLHLEIRPAGGPPVGPMMWFELAGLTP